MDVGYSLATTRTAFEHRAALLADDQPGLLRALHHLGQGEPAANILTGHARVAREAVLVFPGQGSQWPGMAVDLLDSSPVFAGHIRECADALEPYVSWRLEDVLRGTPGAPALVTTNIIQPALFAVMLSLAKLWSHFGLRPAAVIGHSVGEIPAACFAGALSLEDAARVVAGWSQTTAPLNGRGAMASIALPPERIAPMLDGRVELAGVNGPGWAVVSGERGEVERLVEQSRADGIAARIIRVSFAAHSAQIEEVHADLVAALAPIRARAPQLPMLSTVTGHWVGEAEVGAEYWYRNLRGTIRFGAAVRSLISAGHERLR